MSAWWEEYEERYIISAMTNETMAIKHRNKIVDVIEKMGAVDRAGNDWVPRRRDYHDGSIKYDRDGEYATWFYPVYDDGHQVWLSLFPADPKEHFGDESPLLRVDLGAPSSPEAEPVSLAERADSVRAKLEEW